jgi:hypothetical protein
VDEDARLCEHCGRPHQRPRSRFCSVACQQADWYAVRKCPDGTRDARLCRCGRRFLPGHGQQRWCSERCEDLHGQRRRREARLGPLVPLTCEGCGRRFRPTTRRPRRFCSKRCVDRRRHQLAATKARA